ncbi:MAG: (Fe-S)-binding protein [Deferrisomatales bacterium]
MGLVEGYEIIRVLPCIADTAKIRVIAHLKSDAGEAIPYLNAILRRTVYNPGSNTLTFKKEGMCFTVKPDEITATKLDDLDHARRELDALVAQINRAWERRSEIEPSYERGMRLTALQLYRGLPATNCRQCWDASCLAFATKLLAGEASVLACRPLFTPEYRAKRVRLLELLEEAGYEVPPEFLGA